MYITGNTDGNRYHNAQNCIDLQENTMNKAAVMAIFV